MIILPKSSGFFILFWPVKKHKGSQTHHHWVSVDLKIWSGPLHGQWDFLHLSIIKHSLENAIYLELFINLYKQLLYCLSADHQSILLHHLSLCVCFIRLYHF